MNATPPLQTIVAEPPTPLHGPKYDTWDPYPTRRSLRFSKQRTVRTPSPSSFDRTFFSAGSSSSMKTHTFSPPSSPCSPHKMSRHKGKFTKAEEGLPKEGSSAQKPDSTANMLPTPTKTPKKKVTNSGLKPAARVLFPDRPNTVEEAMPTLGRRGRGSKKHTGFSLDDDASSDGKIEIFTDCRDRIPELDESEDNPFYVKPGPRSKRGGNKKKDEVMNARTQEELEVLKRDEGMFYVFRGKKFYKKFEPDDHNELPLGFEDGTGVMPLVDDPDAPRRFTRSSLKPRLLFPEAHQDKESSDEEANTEVEDEGALVRKSNVEEVDKPVATPTKPTFAPPSPPTTKRTTRSTAKRLAPDSSTADLDVPDSPHFAVKKARVTSPFLGWQRTKSTETNAKKGRKREPEDDLVQPEGGKRLRSS